MNYSKKEREFLYLFTTLSHSKESLHYDTLHQKLNQMFNFSRTETASTIDSLIQKKRVVVEDEQVVLNEKGFRTAQKIAKSMSRLLYDHSYNAILQSTAYNLYLEQLGGKNWRQINLITADYIDTLIEKLAIHKTKTLVDLGCGLGYITEYITTKTGARCTGYDFSKEAIKHALKRTERKRGSVDYKVVDLEKIPKSEKGTFDFLISVDGLYSLTNLDNVVQKMMMITAPKGKWGIFFGNNGKKKIRLQPAETAFGKILQSLSLQFFTVDFSDNIKNFWERSKNIALSLKKEFEAENNNVICTGLVRQAEANLANVPWATYYLYIVDLSTKPM